jgi:hypothetical protein
MSAKAKTGTPLWARALRCAARFRGSRDGNLLPVFALTQPLSFTFGDPLKVITLAPATCPLARARMQAVSLSPGVEFAVAATLIGICRRPIIADIRVVVEELADPLNWPLDPEKTGAGTAPPPRG